MALLQALWNKHPATVREVMEAVNENRQPPLAYTTVLKFMQIMTDKRLVTRNNTDRTHTFSLPFRRSRLASKWWATSWSGCSQEISASSSSRPLAAASCRRRRRPKSRSCWTSKRKEKPEMNALPSPSAEVIERLGWTLLHCLWQIAAMPSCSFTALRGLHFDVQDPFFFATVQMAGRPI